MNHTLCCTKMCNWGSTCWLLCLFSVWSCLPPETLDSSLTQFTLSLSRAWRCSWFSSHFRLRKWRSVWAQHWSRRDSRQPQISSLASLLRIDLRYELWGTGYPWLGEFSESQLGFIPVSAGDQILWSAFCWQHGFMLLLRKLHMKTQTRACLALGGKKKREKSHWFFFLSIIGFVFLNQVLKQNPYNR